MRHKIILIVVGLLILGIAAFFYIDNVFLPIQLKRFITTKSEELLHRQISVDSIDFRPIKGFIVKNVSISRKDDPTKPFIQADEITFNLLLAPVFRKKAVILPGIKIKNPYVYLFRDKNNTWNFSDLPALAKRTAGKNSFSVLLRKLTLEGGKVHYKDASRGEEFFESIENIKLGATLSLNKGIRFVLQAQIPGNKSTIKVKGNYGFLPEKLTAQVLIDNIHLARYLPLSYTGEPYARLTGGIISSADFAAIYEQDKLQVQGSFLVNKTSFQIGQDKQISGTVYVPTMLLAWQDNKWNAKGHLELPSVAVKSSDGKVFQGDIKADLNLLTIFENNMTSQGNVTIKNARLFIDENRHFKGDIKATNASLIKGDGKVRLQGHFDIKKADMAAGKLVSLKGSLSTTDTNLIWFRDELGTARFNMECGLVMNNAKATLGRDGSISSNINVEKAKISFDRTKMTLEAIGKLDTLDILFTGNRRFKGSPHFNIFYERDFENKTSMEYKGSLRFTKSSITGLPYLEEIHNLEGIAAIMPEHIQTDKLTFDAQEAGFQLSGLLTDFSNPHLNVKASSKSIDLQKLLAIFPEFAKDLQADLTGKALVNASYDGRILSPSDADVKLSGQLTGATLSHEKLPQPFTDISGGFNYKEDLVKWHDLKAYYDKKPYTFNGQFKNFARPIVDTHVIADDLDLTAQVKLLNDAFRLTEFTGNYLNSSFDLKGDVHLFADAPADIDLRGKFALDLQDAGILIPRIKHRVDQLNPSGILDGEGIYMGRLEDWRNWQLALTMKSDRVSINKYPFENVSIRFTQRDLTISKCNVISKIYGGDLSVTSSADLRTDEIPFNAEIDLKSLDFAQLREDKELKNQKLAGTLSLLASLKGEIAQWRELTGEGSLHITDGYLWQWNIFDGMSRVLFIPEFKNFVFTEAHSDFSVRNARVFTHNARLKSKPVTLDAKGSVNFQKELNFNITPTFSELAILQSESLKKGITSILTQTDGYLNIKLTGTLDKPHFQVNKNPMKIIEGTIGNTTDTLKEVIGGIVGEVF